MIQNVAVVSLSSGVLGESFVRHELELGIRRLEAFGLNVRFMPNALKGIDFLSKHPEARAEDLLAAFRDDSADMILCAIGGDDTYRLLPYLFDRNELRNAATDKIFLGFSDTTINHLMLHKVGLKTFYGQAFLPDICELDREMLPYTETYFKELITTGTIARIAPSPVWYEERTNFGESALGTSTPAHPNRGFELLQGSEVFHGKILGGCIDSLYQIFNADRHGDSVALCREYGLFPSADDWAGRILLLETSEETPSPEKFKAMLLALKTTGVFTSVSGVLVGKPMNEVHSAAYRKLLVEVIDDPALPVVYDLNVGHAKPRCIVPFGVPATVDARRQEIIFPQDF